jgi:hypothetical protein
LVGIYCGGGKEEKKRRKGRRGRRERECESESKWRQMREDSISHFLRKMNYVLSLLPREREGLKRQKKKKN